MKTTVSTAIAYALIDLGVDIVTCVPGYGGTDTFLAYNELNMRNLRFSYHEEAAFTISHSAGICGKRSASMMKAHGFMKAMNSITDAVYSEINAGFVTIIFEDKSGKHSDSILEIIPILNSIPIQYIQTDTKNIYNNIIDAYAESERKKLPVVVLVDALNISMETDFQRKNNLKKSFSYNRDIYKHVVHPMLSEYQYKVYIANKLGGESNSIVKPELPIAPLQFPDRAKNIALKYETFFKVFQNLRGDLVTGDTSGLGVFAFPPYNCVDIITYMGGSIPLSVGAFLAGFKNVWALTGDFGFISAGTIGLVEILQRELPIKIVIFYNKRAASTGGPQINKKVFRQILAGFEKNIMHISNPLDPFEAETVLKEASSQNEFKIIIADYPE
ncbi:MAG: thiamine pyrophosphate-dependent enzyme [Bacteroidota bacterium]